MKENCFIIIFVVLVSVALFVSLKQPTLEEAQKEIPYIKITPEEMLLIEKLKEDKDVKLALESEKITELSTGKAEQLVKGILPDNIVVGELVVASKIITFNYFLNEHRIILGASQEGIITKTVAVPTSESVSEIVYENIDNKTISKYTLR